MTLITKIRNPKRRASALDVRRGCLCTAVVVIERVSEVDCLGVLGGGQPRNVLFVLRDDEMTFCAIHKRRNFGW